MKMERKAAAAAALANVRGLSGISRNISHANWIIEKNWTYIPSNGFVVDYISTQSRIKHII